ncbi:hypothetical protein B296_00037786, partial [Ensete ventricosum]
ALALLHPHCATITGGKVGRWWPPLASALKWLLPLRVVAYGLLPLRAITCELLSFGLALAASSRPLAGALATADYPTVGLTVGGRPCKGPDHEGGRRIGGGGQGCERSPGPNCRQGRPTMAKAPARAAALSQGPCRGGRLWPGCLQGWLTTAKAPSRAIACG